MVFYAYTLTMRMRNRQATATALKELALHVYNAGGVVRSLNNEGIMRPYRRLRDTNNAMHHYVRYVTLQVDLGEANNKKFNKLLHDHPDVLKHIWIVPEQRHQKEGPLNTYGLDLFVRKEEEINWPAHVTDDVYERLDMNWKEFSRSRWTEFLRS